MNLRAFLAGIPYVGWVIAYTAFCWGVFGAIMGVVSPELHQELGNYQDLGLLMAVWAGGSVVGAIQGGRMAHRFAPRRLLLAYLGLTAMALLMVVQAQSFWTIALGFFFAAIFEATIFTLGHSVLANVYTDPQMRGRSLGLVDVAYSVGHLMAPTMIMGLHVFGTGWRLPYEAFFVLVGVAVIAFWPRQPFVTAARLFHYYDKPVANDARSAANADSRAATGRSYRDLLGQSAVRWAMFCGLMAAFLEWGPIFWTVNYAIEVQGLSANQARVGLQFFVAGMVAARFWQAFWHSSWDLNTKLWRLALVSLVGVMLTVSAPLWMPTGGVPWGYWLTNLLYGAGVGVFFPVLLAWMIDRFPGDAARISALQVISFTLGCQLAGFTIGAVSDRLGLASAYTLLIGVALALVMGIARLRKIA